MKDTRVGNIVRPQLSAEFEATKQQWLAWDKWSKGTRSGDTRSCSISNVMMMIALCSKCYNVDEQNSEEKNFITKGMSKRQNKITWDRFKAALNGSTDRAENGGFRIVNDR